jgi:endo-1,4-beta-xylanase
VTGGVAATGGAGGASSTSSTSSTTVVGGGTGGGATTAVVKKFIGNTSPKNKDIPADFATMWEEVSMDANSKWGFVQPDSADKWVWEPVEKVHQYAKDNGIIFKQHNFFWKVEQPSWVNDSNIMTVGPKWVEAFCTRFPDVPLIDVVNEPLKNHNPPPYTKGMGGTGTTGYDWVITAFKWARQYCPKATLIINEYNIIEWDDDHNAFMDMMQKLLAAGAEIDAIGAQGHDVYKVGAAKAKTYLDKLATLNLPIYITEFEVDQTDDAKQKTYMEEAITMFYDHPSVMGITHWGYVKGLMWNQRPNGWLVDTNGSFRPAMTWLQEFIKSKQ